MRPASRAVSIYGPASVCVCARASLFVSLLPCLAVCLSMFLLVYVSVCVSDCSSFDFLTDATFSLFFSLPLCLCVCDTYSLSLSLSLSLSFIDTYSLSASHILSLPFHLYSYLSPFFPPFIHPSIRPSTTIPVRRFHVHVLAPSCTLKQSSYFSVIDQFCYILRNIFHSVLVQEGHS